MNKSEPNSDKFLTDQLFNIAKDSNTQFSDVTDRAIELSRQGSNIGDVIKQTRDALKLSKESEKTAKQAINSMTNMTQKLPDTNDICEIKKAEEAVQYNNIPPFNWSRNEFGLLNHINYVFYSDGSINWRAMIPNEYLVPNRQSFERRKLPIPKSVESLEDKDLLVLLGGIKYLAAIRGFTNVSHEVVSAQENYVAVKTTIHLVGNYETNFKSIIFSDLADAATFNTNSFAKYYLSAIAANRGFVRAWRNALRLPIIAFDEVGETPKEEEKEIKKKMQPAGPHATLQKKLNEKNISFDKFKEFCVKKLVENADKWEDILSVEANQVSNILDLMNKKEGK